MVFNIKVFIKILSGLALLGALVFQAYRLQNYMSLQKYKLWVIFRALTIVFLIVAIMVSKVPLLNPTTTTIFLVDRSTSVAEKTDKIEAYINTQLRNKKSNDHVGIVSFARDPMLEIPISQDVRDISLKAKPNPNFTNIQRAVEFSRNLFPQNKNKRLIIVSDGKQNAGRAEAAMQSLERDNINTAALILDKYKKRDVQLTSIELPSHMLENEIIPINIILDSNYEGEGIFYLFDDYDKVLEKELYVRPGSNYFEFDIPPKNKNHMDFRGEIAFRGDENPHNNTFSVSVAVREMPEVLILGETVDTENINNVLDSLEINRSNFHPSQVPTSIEFLMRFGEVIIVNTSHDDISSEFEQALEYCVKELGKGLIVIGGDKTFALGNYKNTLLEKMLPVESSMRGNSKQPNTGLILAVDCSGSMSEKSTGVEKIDMAKEAAISSLEVLEEEDFVGVLAFSDEVEWIVPFQPLGDKDYMKEDIAKLRSKGGTLIIPALEESIRILEKSDTKVRHIILLTDGQAEKEGYTPIIEALRKQGISLTTVSVGKDADGKLLELLAEQAQGRYYSATDAHQIPKIFVKETYLAAKKYLNQGEFVPDLVGLAPYIKDADLPQLAGYTGAGLKPDAKIILKSPVDDPILAESRYGLGKTIVWTSDFNGHWSEQWIKWNGLTSFLGRIINYCMSSSSEDSIELQLNQEGPNFDVFVDVGGIDTVYELEMVLQKITEDEKRYIDLNQTRAGGFKGSFLLDDLGEYLLSMRVLEEGKIIRSATKPLYLSYSPEYDLTVDNGQFNWLDQVRLIDLKTDVFKLPLEKRVRRESDIDILFFILALGSFIGDIWVRRRYANV